MAHREDLTKTKLRKKQASQKSIWSIKRECDSIYIGETKGHFKFTQIYIPVTMLNFPPKQERCNSIS